MLAEEKKFIAQLLVAVSKKQVMRRGNHAKELNFYSPILGL
jgi:hypothetical protein